MSLHIYNDKLKRGLDEMIKNKKYISLENLMFHYLDNYKYLHVSLIYTVILSTTFIKNVKIQKLRSELLKIIKK